MIETKIRAFIQEIHQLPNEVFEDFKKQLQRQELPKGYFLHTEGRICENIWFIESGLARHFWVDENGKERNIWFTTENSITTDTTSFFNKSISHENIQLIENSVVFKISAERITELQNKYHAFCLWFIKMLEKHYFNQIEQRIEELQFLDAAERYKTLLEKNPSFNQRISLGNLASYLNISQETLSRIRSKK